MLNRSTLFICILISILYISVNALPIPDTDNATTKPSKIVAYVDISTLLSRVTINQLTNGSSIITGQYNMGFNDPNPDNYRITFTPSNYDLTNKITLQIANGGTKPFSVLVNDIALQKGLSGVYVGGNQMVVENVSQGVIGKGSLIII